MINNPELNKEPVPIKRALLSTFNKTGIIEIATALVKSKIEIYSSGGTAKVLRDSGLQVKDVAEYTNFPEVMDGRVKTINPLIEGGILGFRDLHKEEAKTHGILWIDLVICNLYPFSQIILKKNCSRAEALENIDIGGPTMIRSAAKNVGWVSVLVDPEDYSPFIKELKSGQISFETRNFLSVKAFGYSARYESEIHNYLDENKFPNNSSIALEKHSDLRYGENPHQTAAAYRFVGNKENNVLNANILQGKKLSYNNIMDADGALSCLREFEEKACVIVKHANPCGASVGSNLLKVYKQAFNSDPVSAFGGIVALNRNCTGEVAKAIIEVFTEIVLAPGFDSEALEVFKQKKNLRVLKIGEFKNRKKKLEYRNLDGGLLVQDNDTKKTTERDLITVTKKKPSPTDIETSLFAWKVLRHAKSNGILIAKDKTTIGLGAGQVSRVDAVHMALKKGGDNVRGGTLASDAFFPFRDSIDTIRKSGIRTIIQPGGSIRDQEVIDACDEYGFSMLFTNTRCFKH